MTRDYGFWLYHPKHAPSGRLFHGNVDEVMKDLEDGWVDSPARFSEDQEDVAEAPDAAPDPDEPVGDDTEGNPADAETEEDEAPEGSEDGEAGQLGDELSDDELRDALKEAGVSVHPRTGRAKLLAVYNELNSED